MNDIELTVDRIEEGIAVCDTDDGLRLHILASKMPAEVRDGCRVRFSGGVWHLLEAQTKAAQAELFALAESLFDE